MAKIGLTEADLLKNITREQGKKEQEHLDKEEHIKRQRELCKEFLKIWSATTKYIKSQCDKGRLIDTMYFGQFFQAEGAEGVYVHVPSSDMLVLNKVKFKTNDENQLKVPSNVRFQIKYIFLDE